MRKNLNGASASERRRASLDIVGGSSPFPALTSTPLPRSLPRRLLHTPFGWCPATATSAPTHEAAPLLVPAAPLDEGETLRGPAATRPAPNRAAVATTMMSAPKPALRSWLCYVGQRDSLRFRTEFRPGGGDEQRGGGGGGRQDGRARWPKSLAVKLFSCQN